MKLPEILKAYGDLWLHLVRVAGQLSYGIWKISRLPQPLVTVFGSSKLPGDNPYSELARSIAARLVEADISVITGGGPGIMEAANCGAQRKGDGIRSIGIGVRGLEGGKLNPCVEDYMIMHYYFPRKWLLTKYSIAFVVFPGGVGTLEELAELLTLMQTKKREPAPIVLIGTDFWNYFIKWMREAALPNKLIFSEDLERITVTDDIEYAYTMIKDHCETCR